MRQKSACFLCYYIGKCHVSLFEWVRCAQKGGGGLILSVCNQLEPYEFWRIEKDSLIVITKNKSVSSYRLWVCRAYFWRKQQERSMSCGDKWIWKKTITVRRLFNFPVSPPLYLLPKYLQIESTFEKIRSEITPTRHWTFHSLLTDEKWRRGNVWTLVE